MQWSPLLDMRMIMQGVSSAVPENLVRMTKYKKRKEVSPSMIDESHIDKSRNSVLGWLLDSDPAIRWQVMRDLTDAPEDPVVAERALLRKAGVRDCPNCRNPMADGETRHGTMDGTPRCTCCGCSATWV